jgi:hypothetical protein
MKGGITFTEPLPSNDERDNSREKRDSSEDFLKYAVERGSGAMRYAVRFMKIGSAIQKLIRGYTDTQRAWRPQIRTVG